MRSALLAVASTACLLHARAFPTLGAPATPARLPFSIGLGGARNAGMSVSSIVASDRARVEHIRADARARQPLSSAASDPVAPSHGGKSISRSVHSINATNSIVTYIVNVTVGGVSRDLLVDTGSSFTWIAHKLPYAGPDCHGVYAIQYASGFVYGTVCADTVALSPDLVIANQTFGSAEFTVGVFDTDGILGIGPVDLTDTVTSDEEPVATITDNLLTEGVIDTEVIGIFYAPATLDSVANGELTFGGFDNSKYVGDMAYTPLTTNSPANMYFGVDQRISYGNTSILELTSGVVDTGTTFTYLATDAYNAYVTATGAVYDANYTGLLAITEEQYAALEPLVFTIGSAGSFALSPNAQIWPRSLNAAIGGNDTAIYLIVADIGTFTGTGLDFISGYTFLQRFYTVFDTSNAQFGIAATKFTNATTN